MPRMKSFFSMMALLAFLLFVCTAAQAKCMTEEPFSYTAPHDMEACPEDIQNWMNRVNLCAYFAGEEAYDEERDAFIDATMAEYRCSAIGCDFQALFSQYEGDIVYTGILTEYGAHVYGDGENIPQCVQE